MPSGEEVREEKVEEDQEKEKRRLDPRGVKIRVSSPPELVELTDISGNVAAAFG